MRSPQFFLSDQRFVQIASGQNRIRLYLQDFAQRLDGFIRFTGEKQSVPQIILGFRIIRFNPDGFTKLGDGFGDFTLIS